MTKTQQPQTDYRKGVLRLSELLERLREAIVRRLSPQGEVTTDRIAKFFNIDWVIANRFWTERSPGGAGFIKVVQQKIGCDFCDEILQLLETLPDRYKSLVRGSVASIELAFDIQQAYVGVGRSSGMARELQLSLTQFADLFGENRQFIAAVVIGNTRALAQHNEQLDRDVRLVLESTDWSAVRPSEKKPQRSDKTAELARLVKTIQPNYPSRHAMLRALGIHGDSLNHALEGRARPSVMERTIQRARKLVVKTASSVTPLPVQSSSREPELLQQQPHTVIGAFISHLQSLVRMAETIGINPDAFTDGHRDYVLQAMGKLMALAKIDEAAMKRLLSTEGMSSNDPALRKVLSVLTGVKAGVRKS